MTDLIGRWFTVDGDAGIVRYVGPVDGTSGTWLGVEWACANRGKHDGTKSNKRYFTCHIRSPTPRGSFIRPVDRIDWGLALAQAAHQRYTTDLTDIHFPRTIDGARRGKFSMPRLDVVAGFQELTQLETLSLDSCRIYGADRNDDFGVFANVRTLLLASNFLTSWTAVEDIIARMPRRVHTVDISNNPLYSPLRIAEPATPDNNNTNGNGNGVHELRIDSSPNVSWPDVCCIASRLRVHTLSFGWSRVACINTGSRICALLANVRELRLECNQITDISPLGELPALESLNVSGNPLLEAISREHGGGDRWFPGLKYLDISETGILGWSSIDAVSEIPALRTLRVVGSPLVVAGDERGGNEARANLVARLPQVAKLDGSVVSDKERVEMERYYLLLCSRAITVPHKDGLVDRMAEVFPRVRELVRIHGMPHVQKPVDTSLSARLVRVEMQVCADLEEESKSESSKTQALIQSMLVRQLRAVAMRLAKTRRFQMYIRPQALDHWIPLDNDTRTLSFYGVDDSSVIRVVKEI
ncbi:hypothetical protein IWW50_001636 [Coemansia erecta]|nr:hypothetical protein IWW50_001636 [Coemansia erecta]